MAWNGVPFSYMRLADGRWLAASVPIGYAHARSLFYIALALLALAIGIAAYPLVRQISKRLERLQHGVESLGAGDFNAWVAVEGGDEVERLAASFNRAGAQIEQLLQNHKAMLGGKRDQLEWRAAPAASIAAQSARECPPPR